MRLRPLVVLSLVLTLTPLTSAAAIAPPGPEKMEIGLFRDDTPTRVIVELSETKVVEPVAAAADGLAGADVVLRPRDSSFIVVEGTGSSLATLAADPRVVSIRRDRAYTPALASSLKVIGADRAHASGVTGAGQVIAIVDSGIDRDHPMLAGRIVAEACFSATDEGGLRLVSLCPNGQGSQIGPGAADAKTPQCLDGTANLCEHGTHVASVAAGAAVEGAPGPGVAPGAGIIAVQVFSRADEPELCGAPACLLAFDSTIRLALEHIAKLTATHRVAAVNLSVGGALSDVACDALEEGDGLKPPIDALLARGVPTVVAAGNEAFHGSGFPGCVSTAVTVGATDDADVIAPFSNHGPLLDFFAPGVDVDGAGPGGGYLSGSGTSAAAPQVAGALALLRERNPDATAESSLETLRATGRPIVYGGVTTPRIDVNAALTAAAPAPPVTREPPGTPDTPENPDVPDNPDTPESPGDDTTAPPPTAPPPPPEPNPDPGGEPIPVPEVTVTVTVTITPPPPPPPPAEPAPAQVCTRGTARKALTARQWAKEFGTGRGTLTDARLRCLLRLAQRASAVFPEVRKVGTLASAARLLRSNPKAWRSRLDRELLAAWLNWAHGARNITARVNGGATLKATLATAEHQRLDGGASVRQIRRSVDRLRKYVNKAKK